jgi:hypothetical protein
MPFPPVFQRWRSGALALVFGAACSAARPPVHTIGRTGPAEHAQEAATVSVPSASTDPAERQPERQPWSPRRGVLDPAPPRGTVVPGIGSPRTVEAGGQQSAFVWMAVYEVDPSEPRIQRVLDAARSDGLALDPGDAAAIVYMEEVRAAGIDVVEHVAGFAYLIQDGELEVIVRPDDDFHRNDPNGFTIAVGPRGG